MDDRFKRDAPKPKEVMKAATSVAPFAEGGAPHARVTPAELRRAIRRRGVLDLSVFGGSFAVALALAALHATPVGWGSLLHVVLLLAPSLVFQRFFPHRCPTCRTRLESVFCDESEGRSPSLATLCPRCDVEVL